jgi:hypothetical protein
VTPQVAHGEAKVTHENPEMVRHIGIEPGRPGKFPSARTMVDCPTGASHSDIAVSACT